MVDYNPQHKVGGLRGMSSGRGNGIWGRKMVRRREDGFPDKKLRVMNYELRKRRETWIPACAGMNIGRKADMGDVV